MMASLRAVVVALLVACVCAGPLKRSLHGRRVFLKAHSMEEALVMMGQNETHPAMPLTLNSSTPDVIPLSMHTEEEGRIHGLLLQRNRFIEHPVVISFSSGESRYESLVDENTAHYQDANGAVFGMKHKDGLKQFDGSFELDGERYEVHPEEGVEGLQTRGFEGHHPHLVTKAQMRGHGSIKYPDEEHDHGKIPLNNVKRGGYTVQMAIIVDYSEYYRWETEKGGSDAAVSALKYKFSYTYNGMTAVYNTLSGITITPVIKKLHIMTANDEKSPPQAVDTNVDPKKGREDTVNAGKVLKKLTTWGPDNEFKVPSNYDHVMYWVGYQIEEGGKTSTIGLAYVGAICGDHSYSIIEDTGFESWRTASHELGHSLGSSHDTSTGDCADSKKHIMSATEGMPSNAADGIKFSTCSIAAFKDTLAKVTCLSDGGSNDVSVEVNMANQPGVDYNADWQCKWHYPDNPTTEHCSGGTVKAEECYQGLWCISVRTDTGYKCSAKSALRPADGTPCAGGKKCAKGECT